MLSLLCGFTVFKYVFALKKNFSSKPKQSKSKQTHTHTHKKKKEKINKIEYDKFNVQQYYVITKTCLYNFKPHKPHFYIVKLGFTGVYIIFLISAQKHRL